MLIPGTHLGRYEIRSRLGAGGMGEVYLAHDPRLGRDVALKILPEAVADDPGRMGRFEQEARSASALNHPNIVTIYDIERSGSTSFIATEFIEGSTLRERMRAGPMPLVDALNVTIQIAGALAAAHSARIVHRDIKPEMLAARGDFAAAGAEVPAILAGHPFKDPIYHHQFLAEMKAENDRYRREFS